MVKHAREYSTNDRIHVRDLKDSQIRECKIIEIKEDENELKIHFIKWSEKYDEWILADSDRIKDPDSSQNVSVDPASSLSQETIGNLLIKAGYNPKIILSLFDVGGSALKNEKALSKFLVPVLKETAEFLRIETMDGEGKKLFVKSTLIRAIIKKIESLLPSRCSECQDVYSVALGEESVINCMKCSRGSHSCEKIKNFKTLIPTEIPLGFGWLCQVCLHELKPDAVVLQVDKTGNTVESESHSHAAPSSIPTGQIDPNLIRITESSSQEGVVEKTQMCHLYRKGTCPHGLKGNKIVQGNACKYSHPEACQRYMAYGTKDSRGCNPRTTCSLFHPILCRYSLKDRLCTNEKCTFVHLKGTKRKKLEASSNDNKNDSSDSSRHSHPKNSEKQNDPLERLEKMIIEIRSAQAAEMAAIRQELGQLRVQSPQMILEPPPQWFPTQPPYNIPPAAYNHYNQYKPFPYHQPQHLHQLNEYPSTANKFLQQTRVPPEKTGVPSSCY